MNEMWNTFKKLKKQGLVNKKVFLLFCVPFFEKMKIPKLQLLAYTLVQHKFPIIQYLPEGLATNDDKIMIFSENMEISCTLKEVRTFFEAIIGVYLHRCELCTTWGKVTLQ